MATARWRKTKITCSLLTLMVIVFFCVFNTSTQWGRWLYWQGPSWQDVDRFAWRTVENDLNNVKPFAVVGEDDSASGFSSRAIADFRVDGQTITEFAGQHDSTALIIAQDNSILLEEYFQGNRRDSLQLSFSVTKSVTSILVGIAIDEGLIDSLDDPIANYVDGLKPEMNRVSIRHLMRMTSGINDTNEKLFDAVPAPWSDRVKSYYAPNLRKLATTFTITNEPGETFEYHVSLSNTRPASHR